MTSEARRIPGIWGLARWSLFAPVVTEGLGPVASFTTALVYGRLRHAEDNTGI